MPTTTTGVATSFIDFTRASNATVTDSDGKVKWAPHNLLTNSESFASSPWSATAASIVSNASTAPNGTSTADAIDADGSGALHYVQVIASFTYVNAPYTLAAFMKKDTNRYGWISPYDGTSSFGGVFDLQNGVYVGNRTGGGTTAATITPFPNGWYLCTVTYTPAAATTSYPAAFGTNNDGSLGLSDASTGQIFIWGAHLYRSDLAMQPNTSAYPMYNPTTPKNLLGYTEAFSDAAWGKISGSITATNVIAPNGLGTADTFTPANASAAHYISTTVSNPSTLSASLLTISVYLKPNGYTKFGIREQSVFGAQAAFTLSGSGSTFAVITGTATANTASITPLSDGWYRCSMTITGTGSYKDFRLYVLDPSYTSGVMNDGLWTADGSSGIHYWGAQISDSASLDSYVPVYGAAVTSAAYYGPRRDFDGATLACKGLLVEEQRTNLVRYSRTLETTGSYWGGLASGTANTVTIDNAPGPDGLSTSASMITYNTAVTGAGTYSAWRHTLSTTANGTYTFTIWLKAGTTSSVYLRFSDSGGNRANTLCTLTSSWQRFTVTGTTAASITTISCDVGADGNAGGQTLTAGTVYASGAQLEAGGFATSYVPNGSTINGTTRNADVASVSTQAFPYSQSAGSLIVNLASLSSAVTSANFAVLAAGDSANDRIALSRTSASQSLFRVATGGSTQFSLNNTIGSGAVKIGAAFTSGDFASVADGGAAQTTSTGTLPTNIDKLHIGKYPTASGDLNGHIRQITYLPRRLTNTELQTRTA
jgi:hypothetical protein